MSEARKLAATLAVDLVCYGPLTGTNEERTRARLCGVRRDLVDPTIGLLHGRVVDRASDGTIVAFRSVIDAVRCAIKAQGAIAEQNAGLISGKARPSVP